MLVIFPTYANLSIVIIYAKITCTPFFALLCIHSVLCTYAVIHNFNTNTNIVANREFRSQSKLVGVGGQVTHDSEASRREDFKSVFTFVKNLFVQKLRCFFCFPYRNTLCMFFFIRIMTKTRII